MVYRPNFKLWLLRILAQKSRQTTDSSEMQGRVLPFKGRFDLFEAISADSGPQNVLKIA